MFKIISLFIFLALCSCHPFSFFKAPKVTSIGSSHDSHAKCLHGKTLVAVDKYGIPYIKTTDTMKAFYALGFMHARDRLFQLDLMRHAALGRIGELFGERGLGFDRKLRVLSYRLDEQMEKLSKKEHQILESYVQGVNDGAKQRGRTAEHFLLGINFEPLKKREVIAIARLQTWYLASDLFSEISRLKIARSDWSIDAKNKFIAAIDDQGAAILNNAKKTLSQKDELSLPSYVENKPVVHDYTMEQNAPIKTSEGASNAWAVAGRLSSDGQGILMNDPHLQHTWPSNFYLVTLDTDDFFVTGATFVGLPAVLIGATKTLAFGVTASFLNTQDAVLLTVDKKNPNSYLVNGEKMAFIDWPQEFCLNKKGRCHKEIYQQSIFGPVVRHSFDNWIDKDDAFALQWTGFKVDEHKTLSHKFMELAKAKTVNDAIGVVKDMTLPGVNLILADSKGDIGYAYAGLVPKRDAKQNLYLPLDGRMSSSAWSGFLSKDEKPSVVNPQAGYLITANQNIFHTNADTSLAFGKNGAPPLRAFRIKERIEALLKQKKLLDFNDLSLIQLDDTSVEAKKMAPLVGALCKAHFKDAESLKKRFAEEIAQFNGSYDKNSLGAFPYELLMHEIVALKLKGVFGNKLPELTSYTGHATYTLKQELLKELLGQKSPLFKNNEQDDLMGKACENSYQALLKKGGKNPKSWRFGRHHYLKRESVLTNAPLVGGLFRDQKREVNGHGNAPMAESGFPVSNGANLRLRVKLSTPPKVYAVIDSGNSGDISDKNAFNQASLWHEGKSIELATDFDTALKNSVMHFKIE